MFEWTSDLTIGLVYITYPGTPSVHTGFIEHTSMPLKPVHSFYIDDLFHGHLAYRPVLKWDEESELSQSDSLLFNVTDSLGLKNQIVDFTVISRPTAYTRTFCVAKRPLVVTAGSRVTISSDTFVFSPKTNVSTVSFVFRGGRRHGWLENGKSFTFSELSDGKVVYKHNSPQKSSGFITFKIISDIETTKLRIPIQVLPTLELPKIESKFDLEVKQGSVTAIMPPSRLLAEDTAVECIVTQVPVYGDVVKSFKPLGHGVKVSQFSLYDLHSGFIFYSHNSGVNSTRRHDQLKISLQTTAGR